MRWWKAPEMAFLDRRLQRLPASLFRLWFNLNCVASWSGGRLPDLADVAFLLRTSPAALTRRLDALRTAGLIAEGEGGEMIVVGAVETAERATDDRPAPMSAAERTRRWREARRERDAGDAARDDAVTAVTGQEIDKTREESQIARDARGECDDAFNRFWSAYPSRDGDNPRQPAEAAFRRAVADGADPEAMIAAARRYAAAVAGREGRYICSAVRWLTERRFEGSKPVTTATPATAPTGHWVEAGSAAWAAWSDHWRETKGRTPPVDAKGGWRFPAPMPPAAVTEVAA